MVDRKSDGSLNRFTYFFPKNLPPIHSVIDQNDNSLYRQEFSIGILDYPRLWIFRYKVTEVGADVK